MRRGRGRLRGEIEKKEMGSGGREKGNREERDGDFSETLFIL